MLQRPVMDTRLGGEQNRLKMIEMQTTKGIFDTILSWLGHSYWFFKWKVAKKRNVFCMGLTACKRISVNP